MLLLCYNEITFPHLRLQKSQILSEDLSFCHFLLSSLACIFLLCIKNQILKKQLKNKEKFSNFLL